MRIILLKCERFYLARFPVSAEQCDDYADLCNVISRNTEDDSDDVYKMATFRHNLKAGGAKSGISRQQGSNIIVIIKFISDTTVYIIEYRKR